MSRDRQQALSTSNKYNGIDFVDVVSQDELALRVHFRNTVPLKGSVQNATISGGEVIQNVVVHPIDDSNDWAVDAEGRPLLTLHVDEPGGFSDYVLTVTTFPGAPMLLDEFYSKVQFSFKAGCDSDLDCAPVDPMCPVVSVDAPPIDYLAKDFASFRKALSDFSAQRYPRWVERSEADLGMVMIEAMSAVADDLSYSQDRIAAEATLDTATQRRSIVRLARLVDYEPQPILSATVMLQFNVDAGALPAGVVVLAEGPDGSPLPFETDPPLDGGSAHAVDPMWNAPTPSNPGIQPYYWDNSKQCLPSGATEMWVVGHGYNFFPGQALLIDTAADTSADPHERQIVHLAETGPGRGDHAVEEQDPLFLQDVTHIRWSTADKLQVARNLDQTFVAGNLVPATQGRTYDEFFAIPPEDQSPLPAQFGHVPLAVTRTGPNSTPDKPVPQYQYTLRGGRLGWRMPPGLDPLPEPQISLIEVPTPPATVATDWDFQLDLLDADGFASAYTVDSVRYAVSSDTGPTVLVVAPIKPIEQVRPMEDYAGDDGDTVRFGDNSFGRIPAPGSIMQVQYRTSAGRAGNVAPDSIRTVEPTSAALISSVTNPFEATGGADAEPADRIRRLAPQKFRADPVRAVRPEDYAAAAKKLNWVGSAGAAFHWTGSWMTVFTTPDPVGREGFAPEQGADLVRLLNRRRLAGYESYVLEPVYVPVDLQVAVCVQPDAYRAEVKAALLAHLGAGILPDGTPGFFNPGQFTFGTPLITGRLEQAIQYTPGVSGVLSILYRRRDANPTFVSLPDEGLQFGRYEILRLDNDPNRPNMGSLRIEVEGGK